MHKVNSPVEMQEIEYKIGSDGKARVWLRKNQIELPEPEEENGVTGFEADEVYFTVTPEEVSKGEIDADVDFFFEQMAWQEDGADADHLSILHYKARKRAEISAACEASIYAGMDVSVSGETEHFSLTEKDQLNLFGKQAQLAAGAQRLEYHQDGNPCKYYTAEEMSGIIEAAMYYVSFQTTYCNSLYTWLESCTRASEMAKVAFGVEVPEKYQSEVLKDYINV